MDRLTIIIVTNGVRWDLLRRCLASIVTQSIVPKIICVHNHNMMVPELPKGARHIRSLGNVYKGFNAGVLESKTKWIMFLGEGDYLFDAEWVENILEQIENSGKCNYIYHLDLMYGFSKDKIELEDYAGRELEIPKIVSECKHGVIPHSGAVYKKSLHKLVGMYAENRKRQGATYWICKAARLGYLKLKTYKGEGLIVSVDNRDKIRKGINQRVLNEIRAILDRADPPVNKSVNKALCVLAGELDKSE